MAGRRAGKAAIMESATRGIGEATACAVVREVAVMAEPDSAAGAVLLASNEARFVDAAYIVVDGGRSVLLDE